MIEQMGAPAELYENPRSTFVANFLGQSNLVEGAVLGRDGDTVTVDMRGTASRSRPPARHTDGARGWVGIRPEKVLIGEAGRPWTRPAAPCRAAW